MALVEIYTTDYCPFCEMAKTLLSRKGVEYHNFDVSGDAEKRNWLVEASGQRTVPQIFINSKSIGGFTELSALNKSGELDKLLAESS